MRVAVVVAVAAILGGARAAAGQDDDRAQYPAFLLNSYFSVNVGYIDYGLTDRQLEPGFHAAAIAVPHVAARVAIFGHEFSRYFALQATYMRPVRYVTYTNVNGDLSPHHVWANFGGIIGKLTWPVTAQASVYGEGGFGITSRHGFGNGAGPIVRDAQDVSGLLGGGIEYRLNPTWHLTAGAIYSTSSTRDNQPGALLMSGGFRYTMRRLPEEEVQANSDPKVVFPRNAIQLEYSTGYGYGVNNFLSKTVPIFWSGDVNVDRGVAVHYTRNVFHTARVFALDLGTSASTWRSRENHERFFTLSAYPLLRFTVLRTRPADLFVAYSLAGPTFISRVIIDGRDTGGRFTFQDFMEAGAFIGRHRRAIVTVKINHYSNGNLLTQNAGLKIPLTFGVGYTF
ncbi:MAG TPA: acyloxyacyl hydrolase [Vicinamibacterales bacterium]|nr:acyloxyacyl hydrolase [Vicinamibacterales bacterium]